MPTFLVLRFVVFGAILAVVALTPFSFRSSHSMAQQSSGEPLEQLITDLERQELEAIKRGNIEEFAALIADDAVFLNSRGFGNKALVVRNTAAFKLEEFAMQDIRVVRLSDTSGLIAYKLTEKGNSQGREISGQVYASAVWAQKSGKWVCLFSQETPVR